MPESAFPLECERCGERAAVPVTEGTYLDQHRLQLAVQCLDCSHGWLMHALNEQFTVRRKTDRRTGSRIH